MSRPRASRLLTWLLRSWTPPAVLALGLALGCGRAAPQAPPPIRVAAAADLALAFEALGADFERRSGRRVTFSFGSTGLLARQITQGAPFDLFAAANESFVDAAVASGACDGATKAAYARGRVVVWTRRDGVRPPMSVEELADARFARVAIAHPEHAPYGQAAKQALITAGIWDALEPRLVYGENVRQTLQLAESGNVEAAIVALSLVTADATHPWLLVDDALHRPIDQALVVCTRGADRDGGEAFARFVSSPEGRVVMRRHGFLLPNETLPEREASAAVRGGDGEGTSWAQRGGAAREATATEGASATHARADERRGGT
ncbi:MAG: molybdate ABC transporter substrate-binding protein [Myxococcales bacterium]|nr:molybdate ABC transporter substrate-binding protein [Myxococcales bacterium]